tara:strand:- start:268 stop:459 length:192 start_codon:yes stop_codon:yes gene_type:complete
MTIEYTLLVTIIGLIGYIILVINEAEKRNQENINLITINQLKTDEKIIELRDRLEELVEEGKL